MAIGADKVNTAYLKVGVRSAYFFKLESATEGQYLIKASVTSAEIKLYNSLDGVDDGATEDAVMSVGSALVVTLEANTPVYIAVRGNNLNPYTLIVTDSTDKGISPTDPAELVSGNINPDDTLYYIYEAIGNGIVTVSFTGGENDLQIFNYPDEVYEEGEHLDYGINEFSFAVTEGNTYYIKLYSPYGAMTGTLNVSFAPYNTHDYTITLSDGENAINNATVSLVYNGGEITTVTNNNDGTYTFANVDSSKSYTVKVSGLVNCGYYSDEAVIGRNVDTETAFTLTVYQKYEYKVKIALPTGDTLPNGSTLEGIEVSLGESVYDILTERDGSASNASQSIYTALTDADGIATFNILDSYEGSYTVYVKVPTTHSLYGKYAYFVPEQWGEPAYVEIIASEPGDKRDITDEPLALTAVNEYTVTLTSGDGSSAPASVTVNGISVVGGKVLLPADVAEITSISAEGYSFGSIQLDTETKTVTATYADTKITLGVTKAFENAGVAEYEMLRFQLTIEEDGTYNFVFANITGDATDAYLNIECDGEPVGDMNARSYTLEAGKTYDIVIGADAWNEGEVISGTITVTKAA